MDLLVSTNVIVPITIGAVIAIVLIGVIWKWSHHMVFGSDTRKAEGEIPVTNDECVVLVTKPKKDEDHGTGPDSSSV